MPAYRLSAERIDQWRNWLTLNDIPRKQVSRSQFFVINGGLIDVLMFEADAAGKRVWHNCTCDYPDPHLATHVELFPLIDPPGEWADSDRDDSMEDLRGQHWHDAACVGLFTHRNYPPEGQTHACLPDVE